MGLLVFAAAIWALHHAFAGHTWAEINSEYQKRSASQIWWAGLLTFFSYLLLTGYDFLGLRYLKKKLPLVRAMLTSFLGFTFANNLGFFGGAGLRLRFYLTLGLTSVEVAKLIVFSAFTFWIGFATLGGVMFLVSPPQASPHSWLTPSIVHGLGIALLVIFFVYLIHGHERWREFEFREKRFILPGWKLRLGQVVISSIDWLMAATVLYVLMPVDLSFSYSVFLAGFLFAQILALASHVPGGLGVFESVLVYVLPIQPQEEAAILASLVIFRLVYYIAPLIVATLVTGGLEFLSYWPKSKTASRTSKNESIDKR